MDLRLSGFQFTHDTAWQGFMAPNAFLPCGVKEVLDRVLRATFTDPKVARVGLSKDQAKERLEAKAIVCRWDTDRVARAATESDGPGFVKVVQRQDGSIPGATVVAAQPVRYSMS